MLRPEQLHLPAQLKLHNRRYPDDPAVTPKWYSRWYSDGFEYHLTPHAPLVAQTCAHAKLCCPLELLLRWTCTALELCICVSFSDNTGGNSALCFLLGGVIPLDGVILLRGPI